MPPLLPGRFIRVLAQMDTRKIFHLFCANLWRGTVYVRIGTCRRWPKGVISFTVGRQAGRRRCSLLVPYFYTFAGRTGKLAAERSPRSCLRPLHS
jgi:hypothetical protein